MGWFSVNENSSSRAVNLVGFMVAENNLNDAKQKLSTLNSFVDSQAQRAKSLHTKISATTGASSALGSQMQAAINQFNEYLENGRSLDIQFQNRLDAIKDKKIQYQLPRAQREVPASGKELSNYAKYYAQEGIEILGELNDEYWGSLQSMVRNVDVADQLMNGASQRTQAGELPRLTY